MDSGGRSLGNAHHEAGRGGSGGSSGSPRTSRVLGQQGEDAAAVLLQRNGFAILARNWRCREGEIDIIARGDGIVICCEGKTRSGEGWGSAAAAVTAVKLRRLRLLARLWLAQSAARADVVRFDVVCVTVSADGRLVTEWLPGVS